MLDKDHWPGVASIFGRRFLEDAKLFLVILQLFFRSLELPKLLGVNLILNQLPSSNQHHALCDLIGRLISSYQGYSWRFRVLVKLLLRTSIERSLMND
jgi:hypothetical protein